MHELQCRTKSCQGEMYKQGCHDCAAGISASSAAVYTEYKTGMRSIPHDDECMVGDANADDALSCDHEVGGREEYVAKGHLR